MNYRSLRFILVELIQNRVCNLSSIIEVGLWWYYMHRTNWNSSIIMTFHCPQWVIIIKYFVKQGPQRILLLTYYFLTSERCSWNKLTKKPSTRLWNAEFPMNSLLKRFYLKYSADAVSSTTDFKHRNASRCISHAHRSHFAYQYAL